MQQQNAYNIVPWRALSSVPCFTSDPITSSETYFELFSHNFVSMLHDWEYLIRIIVSSFSQHILTSNDNVGHI